MTLILLVLPVVVAALGAFLNGKTAAMYWPIVSSVVSAFAITFLVFAPSVSGDPIQSVAAAAVFVVLPAFAAFKVARRQALRDPRIVAAATAFGSYAVTLLLAL